MTKIFVAFLFVVLMFGIPTAEAKTKSAKAVAEQQEQQAWDAARQENSEAGFMLYLKDFPSGRYAGLAKDGIDKLKNEIAEREETELWKTVENSNDKATLESYLNRYPTGRYLTAASVKLQVIKEEEDNGYAMVSVPDRNYEIGKYEVTQKGWQAVMGDNPSNFKGDNLPVEQVSWDDIQTFIQKLNAKTGKQYRLPTEAEWEYACNGGSQTEYCGSNDVESVAWYSENSNNTTHPVGQKQANGYGLYDMSGNVWEWQQDNNDNSHPENGRAIRGGAWSDPPQSVRAANRFGVEAAYRDVFIGFRLARTLP